MGYRSPGISVELKAQIEAAAESLVIPLDDWMIAEGALALLAERGEWAKLERAYRFLIRRIATSQEPLIGGVPRRDREREGWLALGRLARDRLGDVAMAIEVFETLQRSDASDMEASLELGALYVDSSRLDDARRVYEELLEHAPSNGTLYERLFEIHVARGDLDRAWCASASASLLLLDDAREDVRAFYETHAPKILPPQKAVLDDEDWQKLRHPDEDPLVTEVFRHALPFLAVTGRPKDAAYDEDVLQWACATLGAPYAPPGLVPIAPGSLVAGASLDVRTHGGSLRERLFLAGCEAACRRVPHHSIARGSMAELQGLFFGAALLFVPDAPVPAELRELANESRAMLEGRLTTHSLARLGIAVRRLLRERGTPDLTKWQRAIQLTWLRAAILLALDPCAVRSLLAPEDVPAAAAFTASRSHTELRMRLGVAIGAADRPSGSTRRPAADTILRALVAPSRPPATVGALSDALGIRLDAGSIESSMLEPWEVDTTSKGMLVVPRRSADWLSLGRPHLSVHYEFNPLAESPIASLAELRERKVRAFSVFCYPRESAEAALRARFGTPARIQGAKGDDYFTFGPWVFTARSSQLGWFELLPDWLRTPVDLEARQSALCLLADGIPKASNLEELRALVELLPIESGVIRRPDAVGVGLEFLPPVPVKMLDFVHVLSPVVVRDAEGHWVLRRLPWPGESGPTQPLIQKAWTLIPRLRNPPTAGTVAGDQAHLYEALDVVTWMRVVPTSQA